MTIWSFIVVAVFISTYGLVSGQVNLQPLSNSTVCGDTTGSFSCQTTAIGLLEWRDASGTTFRFTASANDPGATASLGEFSLLLTEESGNTLMSTATIDRVTSDILLFCFDGVVTESVTVNLADRPSAPRNLNYNATLRLLTWDPPADTPNCCVNYTLQLVNEFDNYMIPVGPVLEYNISRITINTTTTFRLYCEDRLARQSASSLVLVTVSPTPSPTCPTCPTFSTSPPDWVWIVIGILAVLLFIATIIATVMTALYIKETCCKPIDDISMQESGVEMK